MIDMMFKGYERTCYAAVDVDARGSFGSCAIIQVA
jgi:hypothetical protein